MPEVLLGKERDRAEGIERGREQGRERMILEMLRSGKLDDLTICEIAHLSRKQLDEIKKKLPKH